MNPQFLGIEPERLDYSRARSVILPVPFEESVSYGSGTSNGPDAILAASAQVELYDVRFEKELPSDWIYTLPALERGLSYGALSDSIHNTVHTILAENKFPVVLGGEHSVAAPALKAFKKNYPSGWLIHLDAHADLRDQYQGNKNSHACTIRRAREMGIDTVSIGIRSMSSEEAEFVRKEQITQCCAETPDFWKNIESAFKNRTEPAWISFDIDALDPSIMPATGTPEPGGLSWEDTMRIIDIIRELPFPVLGMDLVEFAPITNLHAADFLAAKLLHRLILVFSTA